MVLTDEQQTDAYPVASMETAQAAVENTYYSKIEETRSAKPPGYPDDTYTNPNDFVSKLNGDGNKIGTGIVLKVMSGDAVNIRANSWYKLNGASPGTPVNPLNDLVVAMSRGISAVATDYGKITITELQSNGVLTPGIGSLLSQQDASYTENTRPKAYLNWILLDEQFKLVSSSSGFEQVGDDNELKTWVKTGLPINRNGYLYVYTSNESPVDVFFDNLQVTHIRGPLQEETHYYPFGLTMAGISSKAAGKLENRFKYNGIELDSSLGLNAYEAHFRDLDPAIGRWWQIDPKIENDQESWSPYSSMANDPVLKSDPLGDEPDNGSDEGPSIGSRIVGGLKVVTGVAEMVAGAAGGAATSWTGAGAVVGGIAVVHGADNVAAGFRQLFGGTEAKTLTEQGVSNSLQAAGVSPQKADIAGSFVNDAFGIVLTAGAALASGPRISPIATESTNSPANRITGHTSHGLNQSIGRDGGRGVNAAAKLDAVRSPTKVVEQDGGLVKFVGKKASVVLNSEGKVVTTFGKSRGPVQKIIGKGNAALRRGISKGIYYDPSKIK